MAKTNVSDKQEKPNFFQKIGRFFKNLFLKIVRSFKDMYAELKKVTWPTRKELINYSLVGVFSAGSALRILDLPPVSLRILRLIRRKIHSKLRFLPSGTHPTALGEVYV